MISTKKIKIEGPRMEKDARAFFYVLSFSPLAQHNKQPSPRKLG